MALDHQRRSGLIPHCLDIALHSTMGACNVHGIVISVANGRWLFWHASLFLTPCFAIIYWDIFRIHSAWTWTMHECAVLTVRIRPRCEPLAWGCIDEQRQRHDVFRAIRGNRAMWAFRGIWPIWAFRGIRAIWAFQKIRTIWAIWFWWGGEISAIGRVPNPTSRISRCGRRWSSSSGSTRSKSSSSSGPRPCSSGGSTSYRSSRLSSRPTGP